MALPKLKIGAFLNSMLEDNSGGYSTVRVLLVITTLTVLFVFVRSTFQSAPGVVPDIPGNVYALLGTMWAVKGIQRFGEKASTDDSENPPTQK